MMKKALNNHLLMSGFYKGISGLSLFFSIRLLIDYLGNDNYGIWVLIFTLFQFVLLVDFGIQSALKTKIPLLISSKNDTEIKSLILVSYKISTIIAVIVFLLFYTLINLFDFKEIFNITTLSGEVVEYLFLLNIFFFCINFVANIHKSLFVAFFKGKYAEESLAVNQIGFLVLLFLLIIFFPFISGENKLYFVSIINGGFCFFINIVYTIRFFKKQNITLKNTIPFTLNKTVETLKLGLKFMVIQIGMIIIFSSDNYIISNILSPEKIVAYEVVNKLFLFPFLILYAAMSPLWSIFAKNYLEKNKEVLKKTFKKFNWIFIGLSVCVFALAYLTPFIISIWIKEEINLPSYLILLTALVTLLRIFVTFYTFFLNGIGELNYFLVLLVISVLIKIPLSYYFVDLAFGINSVLIASLLILIVWSLFIPIKSYKIINSIKK